MKILAKKIQKPDYIPAASLAINSEHLQNCDHIKNDCDDNDEMAVEPVSDISLGKSASNEMPHKPEKKQSEWNIEKNYMEKRQPLHTIAIFPWE